MPAVPNGSIVTYIGQFSPGVGYNSSDVQAAITSALLAAGLPVLTYTSSGETFFSIGTEQLTVTIQCQVQTGFNYASESDVASLINHAIYTAFGVLPAGSIPRIQLPSGSTQTTGQPTPAPATTDTSQCVAGSSSDLSGNFSLSCWFGNLTTKGLSTVGLLAIAIAVAIGIFVFAPRPRVQVG